MLTLQTLRDKGGVVLAILIGIALLAFLLGDMLSSSSLLFGSANKVGKVEGSSINAQDYSYKLDFYSKVNEQLIGSTPDLNDRSASQAWQSFLRENIFTPQFEALGLNTSSEESQSLLTPENPSPVILQNFSDPATGAFSKDTYKQFINAVNYDATGSMMNLLSYFKSESDFTASMIKLSSVLAGGYFPTDAEVKMNSDLQSAGRNIRFVYKKTASVPDSVISYSDADVKKFYEEYKNHFRTEEIKKLNYVTFNVYPSDDDFVAAQKYVDEMAKEFETAANPKLYAEANSADKGLSRYYSKDQLDTEIAEYAFSNKGGIYGPKLQDRIYTLAKVMNIKNIPDSMDISHIAIQPEKKQLADSLMGVLAKGADFGDLAMQFSASAQTAQNGGHIGIVDPIMLGDEISEKIIDITAGKCVMVELSNGIHIFKVNKVIGGQPKANIAMISYVVEPSKTTRNAVYNRASKFAAVAAGGNDNFMSATTDSVLDMRIATISPESTGIEGIDNSREVVTWAFAHGEEEGTSHVMEFGDQYLIAAVASSQTRGISTLDAVRDQVESALSQKLKAQYLKEQFATATSIEDVATKFNLAIQNAEDMRFTSFAAPEIGFNVGLAGGIFGTKVGQMSKPVVTNDAVILLEVLSETQNESIDPGQIRETLKADAQQTVPQTALYDVYNKAEIIDQRYKLYR